MQRTIADLLLLFPSKGPNAVDGVTREEIPFENGVLEMWSARTAAATNTAPAKFVLVFHGNGSRGDREFKRMPRIWGRFPAEVCAVSYPGFGGSCGSAKLSSLAPAALAAFDAISAPAAGRPILLAGHSMGTVVALLVAARRNVAGLVLHNPPPLRELILGRFGWCTLWFGANLVARGVPPELDSLANARLSNAPAVFLLGARDILVTPRYQHMIVNAYHGPKRIVDLPQGRHDTPVGEKDLPAVEPAMDWLWSMS